MEAKREQSKCSSLPGDNGHHITPAVDQNGTRL